MSFSHKNLWWRRRWWWWCGTFVNVHVSIQLRTKNATVFSLFFKKKRSGAGCQWHRQAEKATPYPTITSPTSPCQTTPTRRKRLGGETTSSVGSRFPSLPCENIAIDRFSVESPGAALEDGVCQLEGKYVSYNIKVLYSIPLPTNQVWERGGTASVTSSRPARSHSGHQGTHGLK